MTDLLEHLLSYMPPQPGYTILGLSIGTDLTDIEIANRLNLTPTEYKNLLNGKYRVTPELANNLVKLFGRTPEYWIAWDKKYLQYLENLPQ